MTVCWNERALTQLRAAQGWIKKDNPIAAEGFGEAVTALVDPLGEFPAIGVRTDEPGVAMFPPVRYRYRIYYKGLDSEEARIIQVHHASRKRPA